MAQAVRRINWFAIAVTISVVVALVVITVIVVVMNNAAAAPEPTTTPQSSTIDQQTGAISFGTGPNTVDTYVDFMCPVCNRFEQTEGDTISQLIDDGTITLNLHPVSILDSRSQGTQYSTRAASAMYAVAEADPSNAYAFMQAMYANQPAESTPGLTDEQIIEVARSAGVNVTPELEDAITSQTYAGFVAAHGLPEGATGTPTLVVNGASIPVTFDPQTDIVANLNG